MNSYLCFIGPTEPFWRLPSEPFFASFSLSPQFSPPLYLMKINGPPRVLWWVRKNVYPKTSNLPKDEYLQKAFCSWRLSLIEHKLPMVKGKLKATATQSKKTKQDNAVIFGSLRYSLLSTLLAVLWKSFLIDVSRIRRLDSSCSWRTFRRFWFFQGSTDLYLFIAE